MPYETGAKVKLTRDVQITASGMAAGAGAPGPLFLAEGLDGVVAGSAKARGGMFQDDIAAFEKQVRDGRFHGYGTGLVEQIREQLARHGAYDAGAGTGIAYRVRFANGFVLDGLDEDALTRA
ncbi:hypothetical protein ASE09_19290 [Streptomyces sp. Root66D1]|nr:hypothetical protein [Streptomyces sp. Root66D1]KRA80243.1 hypothetical protein ASE09_19290 [Streptomyces sp. Root66D1]